MTLPRSYLRNCTTAELNRNLAECDSLEVRFKDAGGEDARARRRDALQAEKDRRLADPNGPDFRPQFN